MKGYISFFLCASVWFNYPIPYQQLIGGTKAAIYAHPYVLVKMMKLLICFASLVHGVFPTGSIADRTRSKRPLESHTTADGASKKIKTDAPDVEEANPFVSFKKTRRASPKKRRGSPRRPRGKKH